MGLGDLVPATHVGNLVWFWSGTAVAIRGLWRVNQWMDNLVSLCLSKKLP